MCLPAILLADVVAELAGFVGKGGPGCIAVSRSEQKANTNAHAQTQSESHDIPRSACIVVAAQNLGCVYDSIGCDVVGIRSAIPKIVKPIAEVIDLIADAIAHHALGLIGVVEHVESGANCNLRCLQEIPHISFHG
jgi:hypothetical protein